MGTLYIECYSGVSGDMTVAAFLDLGVARKTLIKGLESLDLEGYSIKISKIRKNGLVAHNFDVILENYVDNMDSFKINRNYFDVCKIIDKSLITDKAKNISKKIFKIKAETGSKVHNVPIENFYFHESGAIDSIVDIVGAAICLDDLNIKKVIVSTLHDGHGFIRTRKGLLSIPVPAVSAIAKDYNLKIKSTNIEGEMVTPTGAAIMAAIKNCDALPRNYKTKKIGLGNGKRIYDNEGVLRMYLIEE